MSRLGGRPLPVRPLAAAAIMMIVLSGLSLDRADKLASIGGLFVALTTLLYTYQRSGRNEESPTSLSSVDPTASLEATQDRTGIPLPVRRFTDRLQGLVFGGRRIPLGAAIVVAAFVAMISIATTYIVSAPDTPTPSGVSPSPSFLRSVDTARATPTSSASAGADCPVPNSSDTATQSTGAVLRRAPMKLPAMYYADLDSTCPDWGIADNIDSSLHDITNDGTGLFRSAHTEIATVPSEAQATYEMCLANTDYLSMTVTYDKLKPGDRYCIKTIDRDRSRQSLITIVSVQRSGSARTLVMDVQTWAPTEAVEESDDTLAILFWILVAVAVFGGGGATAATQGKGSRKSHRKRSS